MSDKKPVEKLEPDDEALEQWRNLPQGTPSKQAFAPATGGMRWVWWLVILGVALVIISVLVNGGLT